MAINRMLSEMRRRRIFRTAALYVVGTWLVMQVADVVFPAMDIPERAIRYVLIAALSGFPAALVFGWFYDVGVHGIRRTGPAGVEELAAAQPLGRTDYLILTALVGVAIAIVYGAFSNVVEAPQTVREGQREGPPIIAVLPFASASLGEDSTFFATGVHDDLLTQLAHLQSLRVISRTSVMEYRDTVRNIREIGRALGADAILEGGVQSAGGRIRINAQLIDARTDEHLWAETYDRELTPQKIFDVQAEIAKAIASAMQATLSEEETNQLAELPTENIAAYRAFRRAMDNLNDSNTGYSSFAYRDALEEAVSLDPTFVRAMAELVGRQSYATFWQEDPEAAARAAEVLEQIKDIAPRSADYLVAQAYYTYYALKDFERAFELVVKAQTMRPNDASLLNLKNWLQRRRGDFEGRTETLRLARTLDPLNTTWTFALVASLFTTHKYEEAREVIDSASYEDYALSISRSLLQLQEHGDFGRYRQDIERHQREFGITSDPGTLWEALVADRDYVAAEKLISELPDERTDKQSFEGVTSVKMDMQVDLYWLLKRPDLLTPLLRESHAILETGIDANGQFEISGLIPSLARLIAVEGKTEETELLIRRWRREAAGDHTELSGSHHYACQTLGMAGATNAAVDCIRTGLAQPSSVVPFIEPFLPYYDSIRETPEFIELMAEINADS